MENLITLEMERLASTLSELKPGTEEYRETLDQLEKLNRLAGSVKEDSALDKILKNDRLVSLVGSWGLAGLLVGHERIHVLTSRVTSWIRPRF